MPSDSEIRAELKDMRDRLDQILAGTVRTNTILEQKLIPEVKEMRTTVSAHEMLRQKAVGFIVALGVTGGAVGGKIAHALGWLGDNHKS